MISRFDILFLLLFSTVALPWGIMIFNAEKELIALEPATAELEDYYYDFEGNKFDTPDEYVKAVADKGGDVAKAKAVSENPIFEADLAKIDKKSGVVLIKGRRTRSGLPRGRHVPPPRTRRGPRGPQHDWPRSRHASR